MDRKDFMIIQSYMLESLDEIDPVHNHQHIERVLNYAIQILSSEPAADQDVVIAAVLLHDISRKEERENPAIKHAIAGAKKAESFLLGEGYPCLFAQKVADCIRTHSYQKGKPEPETLEAKILYDADKLDLTGTMGVARAMLFGSQIGEPLYHKRELNSTPAIQDALPKSLLREYREKLVFLSENFFTAFATQLAENQQKAMDEYFLSMEKELKNNYQNGELLLKKMNLF